MSADVLRDLALLTWDGLPSPDYDLLSVEWDNGLAPRSIPYVDGEVHDNVGRHSYPMTARLFFVNTASAPPVGYPSVFPALWNAWQPKLIDGEAYTLGHPILGPIDARVKGGKYVVQEKCRSGIIVDVSWVETVLDPSLVNLNGYGALTLPSAALAAAADVAMAPYIAAHPTLAFAYGRPPQLLATQYGASVNGIASAFAAIQSVLFSATAASAQLLTMLMGDIDVMIQGMPDDVFAYQACDAMIEFYNACANMRAGAASTARPTATTVTKASNTLDGLAAQLGNTLIELIGLNLPLVRSPSVPKGTAVTYYKRGG